MDHKTLISNDHYEVTFTELTSPNVTIVFSSGGALALAQPVEEFKKTISHFNTSYIFVRSLHLDWYNNRDSIKTFQALAQFCRERQFERVYALGESLGGSGALLFAEFYPEVHRILTFSAQYSALPPFCKWGGPLGGVDGAIHEFIFSDYSRKEALSKAVLLSPSQGLEDIMHARFFKSDGFEVVFLKTREHALAAFLKNYSAGRNYLIEVMTALYDEDFDYSAEGYSDLLHTMVEKYYKPYVHWIGNIAAPYEVYLEKPVYPLISEGKKATQSSISGYSKIQNIEGDATEVLTAPLGRSFSNHTDMELTPWWQVDLEKPYTIRQIIVFNRSDQIDWSIRLLHLTILVSEDGHAWRTLYKKVDTEPVGGQYGKPLSVECSTVARYVKIVLNSKNVLNLARVEVYGEAVL
ncbi:discoidin domain-containing protein [Entomobacter blattae]|uniref:F5/8 type C domain protein n=1 Tax=Entomobacter blattae TaxID=2762277 RepID=A0A7H1NQB3_9PROT|nr:discoidin domain-containing protein [Entomobacter blattae]QNT77973.1 F5/8 type C domain protein [Entomobacter blattae]